ncbi:hypothetical protein GCM10010413_57700 [Promicromonospora sukumoe]|uniref:Uncharacterized protein n=1 Tax=Promicromonospora sukumoe TaxID=88382 RepID=A0A7W3PDF6_9MICO|nr:hypothetical protein [Promicromonospora sukumoe]MBA8807733.1 hypothetical protein [Promicromonospora sukumoe]
MNHTTSYTLDATRWASAFPWLELAPEERAALGRLSAPEVNQLSVSIARRAIEQQVTTPLYLLFPTLPPSFELESLTWPARHRNVLRRHQLVIAADLGTITAAHLLATWSVSTVTTEAILARLARAAMNYEPRRDLKP